MAADGGTGLAERYAGRTEQVKYDFERFVATVATPATEAELQRLVARCNDAVRLLRENKAQVLRVSNANPEDQIDVGVLVEQIDALIARVTATKVEWKRALRSLSRHTGAASATSRKSVRIQAGVEQRKALLQLLEAGLLTESEFDAASHRIKKASERAEATFGE